MPQFGMLYLQYPLAAAHVAAVAPVLLLRSALQQWQRGRETGWAAVVVRVAGAGSVLIAVAGQVWVAAPADAGPGVWWVAMVRTVVGRAVDVSAQGGVNVAWLLVGWAPPLAVLLASNAVL
jgi:hypothetical protein